MLLNRPVEGGSWLQAWGDGRVTGTAGSEVEVDVEIHDAAGGSQPQPPLEVAGGATEPDVGTFLVGHQLLDDLWLNLAPPVGCFQTLSACSLRRSHRQTDC